MSAHTGKQNDSALVNLAAYSEAIDKTTLGTSTTLKLTAFKGSLKSCKH